MYKQTIFALIALILIPSIVIICFIPHTTIFDETMDAVKLDKEGNVLATVSLHIQANKDDYLLWETQFSYEIFNFDSLISFTHGTNQVVNTKDFYFSNVGACRADGSDEFLLIQLYCSPSFDRWLLWNRSDETFYVASTDPNQSTSDILQFFSEVTKDYIDPIPSLTVQPS